MALTEAEEEQLLWLLQQEDLEKVSPKLEAFRDPIIGGSCSPHIRIRGCRGGRGAGAKSHSLVSLIVQRAHIEEIRVGCFREIQDSLEESVYQLIQDKVNFLRLPGWKFTKDSIKSPAGSKFIFKGLKDLRASLNVKGLENFDIFFIEEAATIAMESWNLLMPTLMRVPNSQLWFAYNPEEEVDPVTEKIWNRDRDDAILIELKPGATDNPWWNSGLQKEMEEDFKADPDEAEHIWYGLPRSQGHKAAIGRARIRQAMDRNIPAEGGFSCGVDVARFGDDKTVMYLRQGLKVIKKLKLSKADTFEVAEAVWRFIDCQPDIPVKIDEGYNPGVVDAVRRLGALVIPVNFGSSSTDKNKYDTIADEMWFTFPIDSADIPDDPQLMRELSGRRYDYDKKNRKKIEPKKEYKKRMGKSPDDADALLLTYFEGTRIKMSDKDKEDMRARRRR